LSANELRSLAKALTAWTVPVTGVQGFDQAQVTAGGILLKDFDWDTMESNRVPGLYAAGEVLDVDGDCGGFNLQWAWSSALIAARAIDKSLKTKG
jgi:predicted flavoprotein YhiN